MSSRLGATNSAACFSSWVHEFLTSWLVTTREVVNSGYPDFPTCYNSWSRELRISWLPDFLTCYNSWSRELGISWLPDFLTCYNSWSRELGISWLPDFLTCVMLNLTPDRMRYTDGRPGGGTQLSFGTFNLWMWEIFLSNLERLRWTFRNIFLA